MVCDTEVRREMLNIMTSANRAAFNSPRSTPTKTPSPYPSGGLASTNGKQEEVA